MSLLHISVLKDHHQGALSVPTKVIFMLCVVCRALHTTHMLLYNMLPYNLIYKTT